MCLRHLPGAFNPSRMKPTFTLDTNCVIAIADARPEAQAVLHLAEAHAIGSASVALLAISASERQTDGTTLTSFTQFKERLTQLGLGNLELLKPLAYFGIGYFDWCLMADQESVAIEQRIHEVLFPGIPFRWPDFCLENGIDPEATSVSTRWRNAKCDVLAYWSHVHNKRDTFVTSDGNFHKESKKSTLIRQFGGRIVTPSEASQLLRGGGHAAFGHPEDCD